MDQLDTNPQSNSENIVPQSQAEVDALQHIGPWEGATEVEAVVAQTGYDAARRLLENMQLKAENKQLIEVARTDFLTGLLNKAAWLTTANRYIASKPDDPANIIYFLDLANFKAVNDRLGHDIGDRVLKDFAYLLQTSIRRRESSSDIAAHGNRTEESETARLGGDEFALMINVSGSDNSPAAIEQRANIVKERLQSAFYEYTNAHPELKQLKYGLTIGMVNVVPGETAEQALFRADQAMYRHKAEQQAANGSYR